MPEPTVTVRMEESTLVSLQLDGRPGMFAQGKLGPQPLSIDSQ